MKYITRIGSMVTNIINVLMNNMMIIMKISIMRMMKFMA